MQSDCQQGEDMKTLVQLNNNHTGNKTVPMLTSALNRNQLRFSHQAEGTVFSRGMWGEAKVYRNLTTSMSLPSVCVCVALCQISNQKWFGRCQLAASP